MSSLLRRIQRTVTVIEDEDGRRLVDARGHFMGRSSKLGVKNPQGKELLARRRRDKKWGRK